MQKISPCLWFNDEAEEAVKFYTSIFRHSNIGKISYHDETSAKASRQPEESVLTIQFQLEGKSFTALNGGPVFTFTPSVSFFVSCKTKEEVDALWERLSSGGSALMPLQEYPFSERYGWVADQYGLTWQIMLVSDNEIEQKMTPLLMFVSEQAGKAEEAMHFYTSVFDHSSIGDASRYGRGMEPDIEGTVMHADFMLHGQAFKAMDSNQAHDFTFNEAISFQVYCDTQEEIDHYWEKLSAVSKAEQCGWLKDKFGVSWQIVPTVLDELLNDPAKSKKVMQAMFQMKKINIEELRQAYQREA